MSAQEKKEMIYNFILTLVVVVAITVLVTSNVTYKYLLKEGYSLEKENVNPDGMENATAISTTLKNFRRIIDKYYIGEIDEEKMMDETIKGYVNGLGDEYSEYMTAKECCDRLAEQNLKQMYEKARYSIEDISAEDVRYARNGK